MSTGSIGRGTDGSSERPFTAKSDEIDASAARFGPELQRSGGSLAAGFT